MIDVATLTSCLAASIKSRAALIERLAGENTDCYRLLHGTQEGAPGVTLDRYGDLALLQTFHHALPDDAAAALASVLHDTLPGLDLVYNDRSAAGSRVRNDLDAHTRKAAELDRVACEHGVRYRIAARHRGHDPWLFLDLRPTRRAVMDEARGKSVLNLFAYTCGVGVAAAVAGARRVLNIDFTESSLAVGTANAALNDVTDQTTELTSDVFPALRQLAGIRQPSAVRGRQLPPFVHLDREQFALVFLDPPALAKSRFGVVDLVRDYQCLLKPAFGAVADGGVLYCTNNVAAVDQAAWHELLHRCADKHGRPIRSLEVLGPGEDFPSRDGCPPLKVARLEL